MRSEKKSKDESGRQEGTGEDISHFSLQNSHFRERGTPPEIAARSFAFAVRVVKLCRALDTTPGVPRTLANQLLRSGTSVGANLEESKGAQSRADYLAKVSIALKEARETRYWLRLLVATELVVENQLAPLLQESDEITAILTTIVKKVKGQ